MVKVTQEDRDFWQLVEHVYETGYDYQGLATSPEALLAAHRERATLAERERAAKAAHNAIVEAALENNDRSPGDWSAIAYNAIRNDMGEQNTA